ncbi:sulfatase-like hydrolase/transferase [uncultured Roseibium sp.]|uniref:sulfatase family protein n=1 Tax=uncultured Roseibium sp. TaxID=1936171 RepID=UPI00260D763C|nr:sulfatase-like hydrolase/transferase [uncultured Roseibium sp.]
MSLGPTSNQKDKESAPEEIRPNIVFIITDQQRFDTIAAHGHEHMETPNLDRLAEEGVSFSNCHITAASCVPCRASLFTGYYPHVNGVLENEQLWQHTWVEKLRDAGYTCVNVGKMHTNPFNADAGFSERYIVENKDRYLQGRWFLDEWDKALAAHGLVKQQREKYREREDYGQALGAFEWELPEELHSDVFVGNFARWWLDTKPKAEPLFMQIGFPGPHPPYDPTPEFAEKYMGKNNIPAAKISDADLAGQPSYLEHKRTHDAEVDHDSILWNPARSDEDVRRMRAYYYANVTMIDESIGKLMQSLEENGYIDNTVIIFVSDHGDCLGDHGVSQKWSMYDVVTKVPAIVWAPGRFEGARTLDGLCQLFDFGPTILELAGLPVPEDYEAQSLLPALKGDGWTPRERVYCEQAGDIALTGADFITMVRDDRYKLVHLMGSQEGQLFDLQADPDEMVNLWDCDAHAEIRTKMKEDILNWLIASNHRTRDRFVAAR